MKFILSVIITLLCTHTLTAQPPKELDKAYTLLEKGQFNDALREVNQLIQKDSTKGQYYILRGKIFTRTKKFKNAFADYEKQ